MAHSRPPIGHMKSSFAITAKSIYDRPFESLCRTQYTNEGHFHDAFARTYWPTTCPDSAYTQMVRFIIEYHGVYSCDIWCRSSLLCDLGVLLVIFSRECTWFSYFHAGAGRAVARFGERQPLHSMRLSLQVMERQAITPERRLIEVSRADLGQELLRFTLSAFSRSRHISCCK